MLMEGRAQGPHRASLGLIFNGFTPTSKAKSSKGDKGDMSAVAKEWGGGKQDAAGDDGKKHH